MSAFIVAADGLLETPALSQALPDGAPPAFAPFAAREAWCEKYAFWVASHLYYEVRLAVEARPTQPFENEFNSCKLDPAEYERQNARRSEPNASRLVIGLQALDSPR